MSERPNTVAGLVEKRRELVLGTFGARWIIRALRAATLSVHDVGAHVSPAGSRCYGQMTAIASTSIR
jgi:hypothetical protein